MNAYLVAVVCLCSLVTFSNGVTVKVEDFSFSLESVKQLKFVMDAVPRSPRLRSSRVPYVCSNPLLPAEIKPLCSSPKAPRLVPQLVSIARDSAICEICANVACSGC
ncbi:guanylin [Anolis carolinensis]|uniref:Guanylin n=1 Tax=Anolis carolinensis TaxID=28377 RepID=H9GDU9_ANOCA|nr:PREDICTED: guanylin [Anolis carolinensis]|eukprot:XP_008123614.1 PREDICTED: guanylin [Anolis carolinensis]